MKRSRVMQQTMMIALGAAVGANLRYWLSVWTLGRFGGAWPFGTFAVNVIGCLLIGVVLGWNEAGRLAEPWRLLLVTGLLGGFTTFSSFGYETYALIMSGRYVAAAWYSGLSLLIGVVAVFGGAALVRQIGS